jgi:hypothetical protein
MNVTRKELHLVLQDVPSDRHSIPLNCFSEQFFKVLSAGIYLMSILLVLTALHSTAAEASFQEWRFENATNPATAANVTNSAGVATALVSVGFLGEGWMGELPGMGSQTGIYDLGMQNPDQPATDTRGQVLLTVPNPRPADGSGKAITDLELRLVQFVDGVIYKGDLSFSPTNQSYLGRQVIEQLPPPFPGSWVEDKYSWKLTPGPEQISLTITGAPGGTLLDRITVLSSTTVVEVPPLLIISAVRQEDSVVVTWAGGTPPYQIYAGADLSSPGTWQPIGEPTTNTNAVVPIVDPLLFLRVSGQ